MNKCEKCGFLHYRTDPFRKPVSVQDAKAMKANTVRTVAAEPAQEAQILRPSPTKRGRPRIYDDRKAYRAKWMREWRARIKAKAQKEEQK